MELKPHRIGRKRTARRPHPLDRALAVIDALLDHTLSPPTVEKIV